MSAPPRGVLAVDKYFVLKSTCVTKKRLIRDKLYLDYNLSQPVISRHGRRLAYTHNLFHWNIWRMAAPDSQSAGNVKSLEPVDKATAFISSTRDDDSPQFSLDGKRIAFVSNRSGSPEIWVNNSDGSNAVQLTSFAGPSVTTPRWSPDGERIAFDSNAAGEFDISGWWERAEASRSV